MANILGAYEKVMHFTDYCGPARYSTLLSLQAWLEQQAAAAGLDGDQTRRLQLVVEELFANTVNHGFHGESDSLVEVSLGAASGTIVLRYRDQAPPFDPTLPAAESRDADKIGGYGLHLVRSLAQRMEYRRQAGGNVVEMMFPMMTPIGTLPDKL